MFRKLKSLIMGSHYIKVGKVNLSVDQDLMDVICPASGYIPDPSTVEIPDDYIPLPDPSEDKITLLCTDGGYKKMAFEVDTDGGQYTANVYGLNNALIHTENVNSGVAFEYDFITSEGEPSSNGVSTYRVEFVPTTAGNHITSFVKASITGITGNPWAVIQMKLNIPYVTVLSYACSGLNYLEKVTWHCEANNATSFYHAFGGCPALKYIEIPASTSLTTLTNYCNVDLNLSRAVFLGDLPAVTTADYMFNGCEMLMNVNWPDLPSCTSFRGVHDKNYALTSINVPNLSSSGCDISSSFQYCTALTTLDVSHIVSTSYSRLVASSKRLKTIVLPNSLPATVNIYYMFRDCAALESVTFPSDMIMASTNSNYLLYGCSNLKTVTFPTVAQTAGLNLQSTFYNCQMLQSVTFPSDMSGVTSLNSAFRGCYEIASITLPTDLSSCTNLQYTFYDCRKATSITFPASLPAVTTIDSAFRNCYELTSVTLPTLPIVSDMDYLFNGCSALQTITLPASLPAVTTASGWTQNCYALESISECTWPSADVNFGSYTVPTNILSFYQPSLRTGKFALQNAPNDNISSIEIDWTNSSYGGSSPQLSLNYGNMDATELNRIFTALPSVSGKTITVIGNPGAATCDPSIATAKGWTVNT